MTKTFCPYQANGFSNRKEYLDDLAGYWEQPDMKANVYMLADLLGPEEDFDGLVIELEEMAAFLDNEF